LGIIKEETKRMNKMVENILQMSLLNKKEFSLNRQPADIHELIEDAIGNISLQLEQKNGIILTELEAKNCFFKVDRIHFTNVIFNLLDNANKYSNNKPEIYVKTENIGKGLLISVSDKGIGMNRETQQKVFDKFYRATTGNVHTTKGFGLGLSYTKAIVAAHNGEIHVKSEKGRGSEFTISIFE
jgi:two-component system phosphate regulon sensor histidine kinase PhoR